MITLDASGAPVIGEIDDARSQRSIAARSYEWPSAAMTGSIMRSCVIGHTAGFSDVAKAGPPCVDKSRMSRQMLHTCTFCAPGGVPSRHALPWLHERHTTRLHRRH